MHLSAQPVGTLLGYGGLGQLVAEFQLEIVAGETIAHVTMCNVKLALKITLLLDVGGRCKDEPHFLNGRKLFFECLVGVNRKIGRDDGELCARLQCSTKFINHAPLLFVVQDFRQLQNSVPPHAHTRQKYHRFSAMQKFQFREGIKGIYSELLLYY